jgi:nitrate reductase gamma subunit/ferredoxin
MSYTVDPGFMEELKRYGEFDVRVCFSCGHCTGTCPLVQRGESFPRKLIRYAQLGLREPLGAAKAVWSCYYCGECSKSCPRQATPGEFMDAARRYFIAHWDWTTLSRRLYASPKFTAVVMGVLALFFGVLFLATGGRWETRRPALFEFMDVELLHYAGIIVMVMVGLVLALNVGNMARHVIRNLPRPPRSGAALWVRDAMGATRDTLDELMRQNRFQECREEPGEERVPWYLTRRVVHLSIMWGFLGLLGATTLDLLFKEPGSHVPLYYPMRLLGTVSGVVLLYGTSVALWLRMMRKGGPSFERSMLSDWLLLWLLWATTVSGFVVEVAVYLPRGTFSGYLVFLVHVILAMELLLLLPFTKFSHAIYRPVALWIHAFWLRRCERGSLRALWLARPRPQDGKAIAAR